MDREIPAKPGSNILKLSIENKIPHLHECGGHGLCTTCRVRVVDGMKNLSPPSSNEKALQSKRNWDPSIRLACQTKVLGDVSIQRLVWTGSEISKLQLEHFNDKKGDERSLAILFCDMRNFTPLASEHPNFDLAFMLNQFFTAMGDPIVMNNGVIYQYAGDEIIGLFGTTEDNPQKVCQDALRAALGMQYAIERLNKLELHDFKIAFQVGIGLHLGRAFIGHIGHPSHKQFTVLGDPMNITSRIQAQNKALDTDILISEHFLGNLPPDSLHLGIKSMVSLKGKKELFAVHEVLGFIHPDVNLEVQASLEILLEDEEAFAEKFYNKVFERAPQVRQLFKSNLIDQGRMLTHMLGGVVYSLSRPEYLALGLRALGEQHQHYGVKAKHYPLVKDVLLETIYEQLGETATPEVQACWAQAIEKVISLMQEQRAKA